MPPPVRVKIQLRGYHQPNDDRQCPIADALRLSDEDIINVVVRRDLITFSRRSNDSRMGYYSPRNAKKYIDDCDDQDPQVTPKDFTLNLTDAELAWIKPRRKAKNPDRVIKKPTTKKPRKPLGESPRYRASIRTA